MADEAGQAVAKLPPGPTKHIFASLHVALGAKFDDLFAGQNRTVVMDEWARSLAGFRPAELDRGLAEMRNRRFTPTLGEFRIACRPALDPETAWWEAVEGLKERDQGRRGDWSHPAIWRAASEMGMDVRTEDFGKYRGRWTAKLKRELARGWIEDVPAVPPRLNMTNAKAADPNSPAVRLAQAYRDRVHRELAEREATRAAAREQEQKP
jgi:hypothetical protein